MEESQFMRTTYPVIKVWLNAISLIAAASVLIILAWFHFYDRRLINRVTLRLQAGFAVIDIIKHTLSFFNQIDSDPVCAMVGFSGSYLNNVFFVLSLAISFNLQVTYLRRRRPVYRTELYYWLAALLVPLAITLPPYTLGFYGRTPAGFCAVKKLPYSDHVVTLTFIVPAAITLLYCLAVAGATLISLNAQPATLSLFGPTAAATPATTTKDLDRFINRLLARIAFYPIATILIWGGLWAMTIAAIYGVRSDPLTLLWSVGLYGSGTINLAAFLLDPYIQDAVRVVSCHEMPPEKYFYDDALYLQQQHYRVLPAVGRPSLPQLSLDTSTTNPPTKLMVPATDLSDETLSYIKQL